MRLRQVLRGVGQDWQMSPLPSHFRTFGVTTVTVVRNPGTEDEERFETEAHVQAKTGFFAVETPIYEGDVVEFADPRGGLTRKVAASVDVNNPTGPSFRGMEHIHVTWGTAPPATQAWASGAIGWRASRSLSASTPSIC